MERKEIGKTKLELSVKKDIKEILEYEGVSKHVYFPIKNGDDVEKLCCYLEDNEVVFTEDFNEVELNVAELKEVAKRINEKDYIVSFYWL